MQEHNYKTKLNKLIEDGTLELKGGSVQNIDVMHDQGCGVFSGKLCDCDPKLVVTDVLGQKCTY